MVSTLKNIITLDSVSYVGFKSLYLEVSRLFQLIILRGAIISANNVNNITLSHLEVRNSGSVAMDLDSSTNVLIEFNNIYNAGDGGVSISGGDRITLTPSS